MDPLDGTKEFIGHRDEFTVNVALIEAGMPVMGVVFAPARRELYWGDVRAGKAGRIDADPDGTMPSMGTAISARRLPAEGLIAVASRSHRSPETDTFLANYPVKEFRSIGSSLKFCLVASRRGGYLSAHRHHHGMGHGGGACRVGRCRRSRHDPGGRAVHLWQAGFRNGHFVAWGRS